MNAVVPPDDAILSRAEIMAALDAIGARMEAIDARCAPGFPLYSPGTEDAWTVSPGGSWVGGLWAGCWWLRARIKGSAADRSKASHLCQRLAPKIHAASINRGMLFWYGAALGGLWFGDGKADRLADEAAAALAASYQPALQCIPLGTDMGGGSHGDRRIVIDTLAPVIELLSHGGHDQFQAIARRHADTVIAACLKEEGACHAEALHEHGAFRSDGEAGIWSRGQAWAMLGLSKAAARWGDPYVGHARSACEYWLRSRPQPLPPNRLDQAAGLADPSSSLIAALAMLTLSTLVPDGERWAACARRMVAALVRSQYFSGLQNAQHASPAGIFWGACHQTGPGKDEMVESAWGTFFLMEALCRLAGVIKPD